MEAVVGAQYQHYKNEKHYTVLAHALHTETSEPLVIYQAEYDTDDLGPRPIFARPKDMFEGLVEYNGEVLDRFKRID